MDLKSREVQGGNDGGPSITQITVNRSFTYLSVFTGFDYSLIQLEEELQVKPEDVGMWIGTSDAPFSGIGKIEG